MACPCFLRKVTTSLIIASQMTGIANTTEKAETSKYLPSAPMKFAYLLRASTGRWKVPFLEIKKCRPDHRTQASICVAAIIGGEMDEACNHSVARASIRVARAWIHVAATVGGGREVARNRYHSGSSRHHLSLDPCHSGLDPPPRTAATTHRRSATAAYRRWGREKANVQSLPPLRPCHQWGEGGPAAATRPSSMG
jgi:hypothetical protein